MEKASRIGTWWDMDRCEEMAVTQHRERGIACTKIREKARGIGTW